MKKIIRVFTMIVLMGFLPMMTSCTIFVDYTVEDNPASSTTPTEVHITGVSISGSGIIDATATMTAGTTLQLTATITPSDTKETALKWTSSDASVLTVSDTGLLTAINAGTVTVMVSSAIDAEVWAQVTINVEAPEVNVNQDAIDQSEAQCR